MSNTILKILAIINTLVIGVVAFLTVFMFKMNLGFAEEFARWLIPVLVLMSISSKFIDHKKAALVTSFTFDFVLIVYLYNPTDCDSIQAFFLQLLEIEVHFVIFYYIYLIVYHSKCYLRFRQQSYERILG